ncbi:hypothetical protein HFP89_11455 [Wenzhouxiangella sp. XN79A]|uniref:DUF11 domain-containing protein n=1 Tax=Wenzhouxiangella sp. XN79A TaxID=2724193 RepID=UPI00144A703B|nr:DUF11 domain-containing protein [Wenzhouxiangella sp. XN79A]NKI35778.1 hypothetical protein [Wenzhouxiangella sp. XN79A]
MARTMSALAASILLIEASAQSVEWRSTDAAAARLTDGTYTLTATLGQPDGGAPQSAGGLTLSGGFWPVATLADLELDATALTDPVIAGTRAEYLLEVLNRGAAWSTGTLSIALPADLDSPVTSGCAEDPAGVPTCTLPLLAPGETASITVEADAAGLLPPSLTTDYSIAGTAFESDPSDNGLQLATPTGADTTLTLSNTADPDPAVAGGTLTYTLSVANGGPSDDPATALTSTFDPALACGWTSVATGGAAGNTDATAPAVLDETLQLPNGGAVTYTIECAIDPAQQAALTSRFDAVSSVDAADQVTAETVTGIDTVADLALSLEVSDPNLLAGEIVDYRVSVLNLGVSTSQAPELELTLGDGLVFDMADAGCTFGGTDTVRCTLADLPPGDTAVRTISAINEPSRGPREVSVSVASTTPDPDLENNSTTFTGFSVVPIPVASLPGKLLLMLGLLAFGLLALRRAGG